MLQQGSHREGQGENEQLHVSAGGGLQQGEDSHPAEEQLSPPRCLSGLHKSSFVKRNLLTQIRRCSGLNMILLQLDA